MDNIPHPLFFSYLQRFWLSSRLLLYLSKFVQAILKTHSYLKKTHLKALPKDFYATYYAGLSTNIQVFKKCGYQ